jgi:chromosomal replication initiator protein
MDVLLIDDVEFLSKKEGTQEEFFHTFNTLYENQKQIVLTSDRPPREIQHLEERLRSRFQWGLVTDIQAPEYETRVAILKRKSAVQNLLIPEDVLEFIAESITGNVRLLECSLNSLKHYSDNQRSKIDMELARKALDNIFENRRSHISAPDVIELVADAYGLSTADILSAKRKKSFIEPRQTAMYICSKLTKLSLPEIAENFHRKDHTTVMHAVRKVNDHCKNDRRFKERVYGLMDKLRDRSNVSAGV